MDSLWLVLDLKDLMVLPGKEEGRGGEEERRRE